MSDFAKIICATDGAQVLAFKDNGDDGPELVYMTEFEGAIARMAMAFEDEEGADAESKRDHAFSESSVAQADAIRKMVLKFGQPA